MYLNCRLCLILCLVAFSKPKKITFNVIHDSYGYDTEFVQVIRLMMESSRVTRERIPYEIRSIDPLLPLNTQIEVVCSKEEGGSDFQVLLSATSCPHLERLSRQSSLLELLHFAVNVDECSGSSGHARTDRGDGRDVTRAIVDVIESGGRRTDIVIVHDAAYEIPVTARTLVKELRQRNILHTYFRLEGDAERMARRLETVARGSKELTTVVLADFSHFKVLLDGMYEGNLLDPYVTYMIVNDGWEPTNPEIEHPQPVPYSVDVQMLLLKRSIPAEFHDLVSDIIANSSGGGLAKFPGWKNHMPREDVFVAAVVWSMLKVSKLMWSVEDSEAIQKCVYTNTSGTFSFDALVVSNMLSSGFLSESLHYDLLWNVPVGTDRDIFRRVASWSAGGRPRLRHESAGIQRRLLFENRTLKLGMPFNPPYTIPPSDEFDDKDNGTVSKLFDYLKRRLKFRYETVCPEDNEWGVPLENGSWSGAVGLLLSRKVDLIPFLGLTRGRSQILEFSDPVMTTSTGLLVQRPREPPRTLIFLKPFSRLVWLMIGMMVPFMAFVLHYINKKSVEFSHDSVKRKKNGLFRFRNCLWYMYGAILQQGGVHLPEKTSARMVVCSWWLFVMVMMATYSGNLIAFLTVPETDWLATGLEDLAYKDSVWVLIQEGTNLHLEIEESPLDSMRRIKRRLAERRNAQVVTNVTWHLKRVARGKAAFAEDMYVLADIVRSEHARTGTCHLALAPDTFTEMYLGVAARRGSPYMNEINKLIRGLWHGGLMQHWAKQFAQFDKHECNLAGSTTVRGGRKDVTLTDLFGAFMMLGGGGAFALVAFLAERVFKWLDRPAPKPARHALQQQRHFERNGGTVRPWRSTRRF